MVPAEIVIYALFALGLALVVAVVAAGADPVALAGVGCWVASAAILIAHAGPHRRGRSSDAPS